METIILMFLGMIGPWLLRPGKAAPFAKYLLKARDYLMALLPPEIYPAFQTGDPHVDNLANKNVAIPAELIVTEAKSKGFNWPFIRDKPKHNN